jgi:protein-tyrosine phosphatase
MAHLGYKIWNKCSNNENATNEKWFEGCGIDYRHLQVEDYVAPPTNPEIVDYIDSQIKHDKSVIVNCNLLAAEQQAQLSSGI